MVGLGIDLGIRRIVKLRCPVQAPLVFAVRDLVLCRPGFADREHVRAVGSELEHVRVVAMVRVHGNAPLPEPLPAM